MADIQKIKAFLSGLTAVSLVHYQIWNSKDKLVFTTEQQKADSLTRSSCLKFAKKIILSDSFIYKPVRQHGFICGVPVGMDQDMNSVVLAFGAIPDCVLADRHAARMNAFFKQMILLGQGRDSEDDKQAQDQTEPLDHSFEDLYLFANISKQFRSLRLQQPVVGKLMDRILDNMTADVAFLQLPRHSQYNQLKIRPGLFERDGKSHALQKRMQKIIDTCADQFSGNYCMINNSLNDNKFADLSRRPFRLLAVTVRHMRQKYGLLGVMSYTMEKDFKHDELNIMQTLSNQLSSMMANMAQYDEFEQFTVNIVCSLVNAIETKDAYTRGHSKRVFQYAMHMARQLQLSGEQIAALKWAAVLHDIGKIGIPERILRKPGKLTAEEFQLIKQHPMKGRNLLKPIRQLAPSMEAIAYHHERFNGTGYPGGLAGERIPLAARIIAVADTFDAITSKRSYHASKTPQEAMLVLDQVAGTQLDPHLVRIFNAVYREHETDINQIKQVVNA